MRDNDVIGIYSKTIIISPHPKPERWDGILKEDFPIVCILVIAGVPQKYDGVQMQAVR